MRVEDSILSAMQQVEAFSTELHTTSWIWGGLSVDIYQGRFMREHGNLDYLTLHLHDLADPLARRFQDVGWQTRQLKKEDLKIDIQLGHIDIFKDVRWTHNGEAGPLYFPAEWLETQARCFYDVETHVVGPEFQYALLDHPELPNPAWKPRLKDLASRAQLKSIVENKGINVESLQALIHE